MRVTYALAVAALVGATQAQEDEPKKAFVVDLPVSETVAFCSHNLEELAHISLQLNAAASTSHFKYLEKNATSLHQET